MRDWIAALRNVSPRAWRVWQRNLDVFLETWKLNFMPPLLEPVMYVVAFGFGLGSLIDEMSYEGRPVAYLDFMAPGVVAIAIMFNAFFENTFATYFRMVHQRTFAAIVSTPVSVEDVIVGEWLWGTTKSCIAATLMLFMLTALGLMHGPTALLVLPLAVLGGMIFSASGLISTALVPTIEAINVPMFLVIFPMFLFSGTFFPLDVMPGWALAVAYALPLTHLCSLLRGACLGILPTAWPLSLAFVLVVAPVLSVVALMLMRRRLKD